MACLRLERGLESSDPGPSPGQASLAQENPQIPAFVGVTGLLFMFIKKLPARFYRNANDHEPVREWLKCLTQNERHVIGKDIQKVEFGWPLGLPVCRALGQGLWEVRSELPSRRIARVLFCIMEGEMILLHGFVKKTQRTPKRDLELAQGRKMRIERAQKETGP